MYYLIGIQPTGPLHIGNYLGCIKKGLELQNDNHKVTFLIANYHAITTGGDVYPHTEEELRKLGCKDIQYQTPEFTELFYRICCKLNLGVLQRMPQYKDKKDSLEYDMGMLLYPALMAADIMMFNPHIVIVGKDQVPHMEFVNDIVHRIKPKKSEIFRKEYKYEFGHVEKVMSLIDPTKKMSKSLGEGHVLQLFNEDYNLKLRKATMTPEGKNNLELIAKHIGINPIHFKMNVELKNAISEKMQQLFGNKIEQVVL